MFSVDVCYCDKDRQTCEVHCDVDSNIVCCGECEAVCDEGRAGGGYYGETVTCHDKAALTRVLS